MKTGLITMRRIYHIVPRTTWERTGDDCRPDSLAAEGFVHCSNADQVARVANLFFADQDDLLVLTLDVSKLSHPVRDEDSGTGELFPHVYGPIERGAVLAAEPLRRGTDGRWQFNA
jgi:uncharacterized protein (DUF952 family)